MAIARDPSGCKLCPIGWFSSTAARNACTKCPKGWSQDAASESDCKRCQAGRAQPMEKQPDCVNCVVGMYAPTHSEWICTDCPLGWAQADTTQSSCDSCVAGQYAPVLATMSCTLCPKGRWSATLKADELNDCIHCELGKYLDETGKTSASDCVVCTLGRYADQQGAMALDNTAVVHCKGCPQGTYGDTVEADALADCKDCTVGRYNNELGRIRNSGVNPSVDDPDDCKPCPRGRYNHENGQGTLEDACTKCDKGRYNNLEGSYVASSCLVCPNGKYAPNKGTQVNSGAWVLNGEAPVWTPSSAAASYDEHVSCLPCLRGKYGRNSGLISAESTDDTVGCVDCGSGKYSSLFGGTDVSVCQTCPTGKIGVVGETGAKMADDCKSCRPGKVVGGSATLDDGSMGVTCEDCNGGKYQNERGATLCKTCPKGFYRKKTGQSFCIECELGRYMMSTQAQACLMCPEGRFGDQKALECAAFCVNDCKACSKGTFQILEGQTSIESCSDCQAGKYSDIDGLPTNTCKLCGKGKYNPSLGSKEETRCLLCDIGRYSDIKGVTSSTACKNCSFGEYSDELGLASSARCKKCQTGKVGRVAGLTRESLCEPCPVGAYSDVEGIVHFEACTKCPSGTWSNLTGQDEIDDCILCDRGRYRNLTGGIFPAEDCFKCPPGRASLQLGADSLDDCIQCPEGKYMEADSDDIECVSCPLGYAQPLKASFGCDVCPIAKFAKLPGTPICHKCRAGTIGVKEGASSCQLCSAGRYQEEEEKQSCVDCELGKFNNCQASGFCFDCERGTTTYELASTFCVVKRVRTVPATILDNRTFVLPIGSNYSSAVSFLGTEFKEAVNSNLEAPATPLLSLFFGTGSATATGSAATETAETSATGLCVTWTLPAPADSDATMLNQDLEWSTSRLFVPTDTNKTTVTNTTTQFCVPITGGIDPYNTVIYVRITPTIDDAKGTSSAPSKVWSVAPSCDDESYLDGDSQYTARWRCRPCPIGGDCRGPRKWEEVGVIFGYFRLHDIDRDPERIVETSFWKCFKPEACLGSRNPKMEGRYYSNLVNESRSRRPADPAVATSPEGRRQLTSASNNTFEQKVIDLAATNIAPERCNEAHGFAMVCPGAPEDRCRLCRGCAKGYWPEGYANCKQCPTKLIQGLSIAAGIMGVSLTLYLFLQTALQDAGMTGIAKVHLAQPMQKIALNHVQLVSLAASFPLQWPQAIDSLFATFGVLGDAGDYVFNPDCDDPERHAGSDIGGAGADYHQNYGGGALFFQKQLLVLIMPFFIVAATGLFWFIFYLVYWKVHKNRKKISIKFKKKVKRQLKKQMTLEMVSVAAEKTQLVYTSKEDEKRWHAALIIQLWWDRLHHRYAAKISALAKMQVKKERRAEKEAEDMVSDRMNNLVTNHTIHVNISAENELVDALIWPALSNRATFLDTHMTDKVIERALEMNLYQKLTWEHPQTHVWYEEGTLVRWVPKEKCVNLLKGHQGAWRVSFAKKSSGTSYFGKENEVTVSYMSNGEVVSARKRERRKTLTAKNPLLKIETKRRQHTIVRKFQSQEKKRMKYNRKIGYKDKFIATFVTVLYLLYPTLTRATFKIVACQTVGKNRYLQMELDLPCWDDVHLAWVLCLFLPSLLGYVLGLPLIAFLMLRKFRHHLHDKIPRFHFGTLYLGFKDDYYYWEVITAMRKTSIIMVAVFLTGSGTEVQALTGSFINLGALLLHLSFHPYVSVTKEHDTLHSAEMWALTVSFVTLWMGLFFFQETVRNDQSLMIFLTIVLMALNMMYVLIAFRWFLIIKLVDLDAHEELLLQEGMDRHEYEAGAIMERCLKRLVPEWYHMNVTDGGASFPVCGYCYMTRSSCKCAGDFLIISTGSENYQKKNRAVPIVCTKCYQDERRCDCGSGFLAGGARDALVCLTCFRCVDCLVIVIVVVVVVVNFQILFLVPDYCRVYSPPRVLVLVFFTIF